MVSAVVVLVFLKLTVALLVLPIATCPNDRVVPRVAVWP
jgi:hypothetical protein